MKKEYQELFNDCFKQAVNGPHVQFIPRKGSKEFTAMVSVKSVLDSFKPFLEKVNEDIKTKKAKKSKKSS